MVVLGSGGTGLLLYGVQAGGDPIAENPPAAEKPPEINKPSTPQARAKKPGAIFKAPGSATLDVALSADGKLLARAGTGQTVDLWEVASGKKLHTLKGHTEPLFKLAFSPDGKTLASATGGWGVQDFAGEVKLWDVAAQR